MRSCGAQQYRSHIPGRQQPSPGTNLTQLLTDSIASSDMQEVLEIGLMGDSQEFSNYDTERGRSALLGVRRQSCTLAPSTVRMTECSSHLQ